MDECDHIWFRALSVELERLTCGVAAARHLLAAMHGVTAMGKLAELGDRIKRLKADHERIADELAPKLLLVESETPQVEQRAHNYIDSVKGDLRSLEEDLRALSNGLPPSEG